MNSSRMDIGCRSSSTLAPTTSSLVFGRLTVSPHSDVTSSSTRAARSISSLEMPVLRYLGAIVEACGGVVNDMADRIARASRAFGALCKPVFKYGGLSLATKRMVYRAVVLGVLLYGAEAWVNKSAATRKLESFNNKCLRRILGITRAQQRTSNLTSI